ncbi:MAG: hypothetical protein A2Y15_02045 [Clostridiales bacterium GWF2_36_10]|nr:MAG: hypothetical protein A2Y15_02045 [Clostridiales bacterium GWF2_36_10]
MLADLFAYKFIMYALITSVLSSILCGIIGVIIIEKKLVMMSGGIAHTAFGGVGLGYLLNFTPIIGAFGFAVISSLGIGYIKRKGGTRSDVIIGLLWSFGMACGIFFMGLTKGFPPIISSYLFGNILSVTFFGTRGERSRLPRSIPINRNRFLCYHRAPCYHLLKQSCKQANPRPTPYL